MPKQRGSKFSIISYWQQLFALLLLIVLAVSAGYSQNKPMNDAGIETLRNQIRTLAQKTQTITSDFTQQKEMSMIKEKIVSKGKFFFKKDKLLRWEYNEPFSYLIIIRNDKVSIRDENQVNHFNVSSNKIYLEINRIILGSIEGTLLNDAQNFKAYFTENQSSYVVLLKPLSVKMKESLKEIIIYFDRIDYTVNRVDLYEQGGDLTKINFTGKKLNQPIADEKFVVH